MTGYRRVPLPSTLSGCVAPSGHHAPEIARSAGFSDDEGEACLEELQGFREAASDPQLLSSGLHDKFGRPCCRRSGLYDAVGWGFVCVTEHREQSPSVTIIDRIIAPDTACDIPAVKAKQLIQLRACEI